MILHQHDNLKHIIYFSFILLLMLPTITFASSFGSMQEKRKNIHVNTLINKSTLECSFNTSSEELIAFYDSLSKKPFKKVGYKQFNIGESYTISNVKLISRMSKNTKDERTVNMDTDFKKFGVRILRISSFIQGGEDESFGYYIILKNTPSINIRTLAKQGIDLDFSFIEKTKGGNTRIRCILVG